MTGLRFHYCEAGEVAPYEGGLRALEQAITYPLDDSQERFYVDHGERYAGFFEDLGHARFLIAEAGGVPQGLIAGVWKDVRVGGHTRHAIYLGDLKLTREARGKNVAARLFARGLAELLRRGHLAHVRLFFGAAMSDGRHDVRKSFRGRFHLGRLGSSFGTLRLFFAEAAALAALVGDGPAPPSGGVEFSAGGAPLLRSTAGRKDLRLVSTGAPWPLVHLPRGPREWAGGLGGHLRAAAEAMRTSAPGARACFALDARLTEHLGWLERQGLTPGATATIVGLAEPFTHRRLMAAPWVHLSTAEI